MKISAIIIFTFIVSIRSYGQFFYDNPVDSGTFYLKVFNVVGDQEQYVKCGKVKLMYFYQPHRTGFSFKDLTVIAKPENDSAFTSKTVTGEEWKMIGAQNNDGTPDFLEFIRINSKGHSYRISPDNICLIDQ